MTYSQKQIQATAQYIVEQCGVASENESRKPLTNHEKECLRTQLLLCLGLAQKHENHHQSILIKQLDATDEEKKKDIFDDFFTLLNAKKVKFPEETQYLITRQGKSLELTKGETIVIYDKKRERKKVAQLRVENLTEKLKNIDLSLSMEDPNEEDESDFELAATYLPSARQRTLSDFLSATLGNKTLKSRRVTI